MYSCEFKKLCSKAETSLLAKGVTPHTIPLEDIIANVEAAWLLPLEQVENVRIKMSCILNKAPKPISSLSTQERKVIKILSTDKSIVILPADKGNATVVILTEHYNKIIELLDPKTYHRLPKDPTNCILQKLIVL